MDGDRAFVLTLRLATRAGTPAEAAAILLQRLHGIRRIPEDRIHEISLAAAALLEELSFVPADDDGELPTLVRRLPPELLQQGEQVQLPASGSRAARDDQSGSWPEERAEA